MNFEVICFKTAFKICILKICDIYLNSKYFLNQNISQDSKKFWGIFVVHKFPKKVLSNLVKLQKTTEITKIGKYSPMRLRIESK